MQSPAINGGGGNQSEKLPVNSDTKSEQNNVDISKTNGHCAEDEKEKLSKRERKELRKQLQDKQEKKDIKKQTEEEESAKSKKKKKRRDKEQVQENGTKLSHI